MLSMKIRMLKELQISLNIVQFLLCEITKFMGLTCNLNKEFNKMPWALILNMYFKYEFLKCSDVLNVILKSYFSV